MKAIADAVRQTSSPVAPTRYRPQLQSRDAGSATPEDVSPDASSIAHAPNTPTPDTVTVNVHVASALRPDVSIAVHVTVVVPSGNVDPDGGTHATVTPGQLSETVGA